MPQINSVTTENEIIFMQEEDYEILEKQISRISVEGKTEWFSVSQLENLEKDHNTKDITYFYLWLLLTNKTPVTVEEKDSKKHISEYVDKHLLVKETEKI